MSIDLTNSDKLDTSPFVDRYSNVLAKGGSLVKRIIPTTPIRQAPSSSIMKVAPTTTTPTTPPETTVTTPTVTPVTNVVTPPIETTAPAPSGGGGGGGGAPSGGGGGEPSGGEAPMDKSADTLTTTATPINLGVSQVDNTEFYMKMWFWGLLVGGVAGYLLAKKKAKDLKSFALIGAGIGGFGGLVVEKMMNKGVNPKAKNVTVVNAVPAVSTAPVAQQQEEQQEQQEEQQEQQEQEQQ